MDRPSVYVPMDRRQAKARGETLPEWMAGSALFADISGFTPLTEALALELGPRRGAEELTRHLNQVYNAVITELHRYGGSVIGFSGDAITCWLDGDDGRRATACALAMQRAMTAFAEVETQSGGVVSLAMKAAVASGPVRRFTAGSPDQLIVDVMAGRTLERLATAEHHADRGEVIVDQATAEALGAAANVSGWRESDVPGEQFAVVESLNLAIEETPWPELPEGGLPDDWVRRWLLPSVFQRLEHGQGEFLAELRPAVALFARFTGIDYDGDEAAPAKLNEFICRVEEILASYQGNLLQVTVGDKGSYLYAAFGAPVAHEDDVRRAASAALELRGLAANHDYLQPLQIGITHGRMRTGAYGGTERRTYGVLGDAVNLSARLMSAAAPGEILVSDEAYGAVREAFAWESLAPITVKGKSEPITIWRLTGPRPQASMRLQEPKFSLPMVGRQEELALIAAKLDLAAGGKGQIVGLAAEAGMGKTRLAAEVIRLAGEKGFDGLAGEGSSYGTTTGYLVWRPIWRGLLQLDPTLPLDAAVEHLDRVLRGLDPALVRRLPLLGAVLNLPIPDNDLTRTLDAKIRKSSLEAMLVTMLRSLAPSGPPLLLVLEDGQWFDPLSIDLIEAIAQAVGELSVCVLLAYRSLDEPPAPQIAHLPYFTEVKLAEFGAEEAETLIRLKLGQFFGAEAAVPPDLREQVTTRAAGNPYYIEELLNYLRDRGIDPQDGQALAQLDLPSNLYSLILSRIDQLSERQNATLKVASVIGRLFRAAMVWGVYPELGKADAIKAELQRLDQLDLTPLDRVEPELFYLFKHVIIQEVAYESLLYSTRAMLHERIGRFIEERYGDRLEQFLSLLAHHYGRSENTIKKKEYLLKAGHASRSVYDNEAAINFYRQAMPLLSSSGKLAVLEHLGRVLELLGRWDEAGEAYRQALELAESFDNRLALATFQAAMAELTRKQGRFEEAQVWLDQASAGFAARDDRGGMAHTLGIAGILSAQRGDYDAAGGLWQESLAIRRELNEPARVASMLSNLGIVARHKKELDRSLALHEEALALRREMADPWAIAQSLINLGNIYLDRNDREEARGRLEEAVELLREVGDRWMLGNALDNLGTVARTQGDVQAARTLYDESLRIFRDLGDRVMLAYVFESLSSLAAAQGHHERSLRLAGAAAGLRTVVGAPLSPVETAKLDAALIPARQALDQAAQEAHFASGQSMTLAEAIAYALHGTWTGLDGAAGSDYDGAIAHARERMAAELPPELTYHSLEHTFDDVLPAAVRLATHEGLNEEQKGLLAVAAAFHDIGWIVQGEDHEQIGADLVREILPEYGFTPEQVGTIARMILATRMPQSPASVLEEILVDADLDVLGRDDFWPANERLRAEMNLNGQPLSDEAWYASQLAFLESHRYYTEAAKRLRGARKLENLAEVRRRLNQSRLSA